jgi:hypothetical protein
MIAVSMRSKRDTGERVCTSAAPTGHTVGFLRIQSARVMP